jgi:hypothetical protein
MFARAHSKTSFHIKLQRNRMFAHLERPSNCANARDMGIGSVIHPGRADSTLSGRCFVLLLLISKLLQAPLAFRTSSYPHFPPWSIMRRIWSASIVNLISSSQTLPSGTLGCYCLWIALDEMWDAFKEMAMNSWWREGGIGRWMVSVYSTSCAQGVNRHLFVSDARCGCQCTASLRCPILQRRKWRLGGLAHLPKAIHIARGLEPTYIWS